MCLLFLCHALLPSIIWTQKVLLLSGNTSSKFLYTPFPVRALRGRPEATYSSYKSRKSLALAMIFGQSSPWNFRGHHSCGKGHGVIPGTQRSICHVFLHLGNMHLLFARLCASTGPTALNMASMVRALTGLRIQQETQTLGAILISLMSSAEQMQKDPGMGRVV